MKAVRIHEHGDPSVLSLDEIPEPGPPGPGRVLVRMLAVSINHLDLWVRRGMPGVKMDLPHIPGSDGTGEVLAAGEGVEHVGPGRLVVIEPGLSSGGSAHDREGNDHLSDDYGIRGEHCPGVDREILDIEARFVFPLPEGVDPVAGAAMPLVFLTAWGLLVSRAALRAGESVLVLGGASGVGSASIQLARQLGARVLATAGSDAKLALARNLGAEEVVDHRDPEWDRRVRALTDGRGVDVVVEHVGPATWDRSMRSLARNGRLVTCGGTTGAKVSVLLPHLFMKNQSLLGSTMGPRSCLPGIFESAARGELRPVVGEVTPMSEVRRAHERLENREVLGKIVMLPDR